MTKTIKSQVIYLHFVEIAFERDRSAQSWNTRNASSTNQGLTSILNNNLFITQFTFVTLVFPSSFLCFPFVNRVTSSNFVDQLNAGCFITHYQDLIYRRIRSHLARQLVVARNLSLFSRCRIYCLISNSAEKLELLRGSERVESIVVTKTEGETSRNTVSWKVTPSLMNVKNFICCSGTSTNRSTWLLI